VARNTRARLASLCLSESAGALLAWCLLLVAATEVAGSLAGIRGPDFYLPAAAFLAPFLLLAPLNGWVANALPLPTVLAGSSFLALLAVVGSVYFGLSWLACLGLVATAGALRSAAAQAMLPAAADAARLSLPRVCGWFGVGAGLAVLCCAPIGWAFRLSELGVPLLGLGALGLLTALPVPSPAGVRRPQGPGRAVVGFFQDAGRVARRPDAAGALVGLSAFQALLIVASAVLVAEALGPEGAGWGLPQVLQMVGLGLALGGAAASLQGHPHRSLGLVPYGAAGAALAIPWALLEVEPGDAPDAACFLLGLAGGLVLVPLRAAYLAALPADARGNGAALSNAATVQLTAALAGALLALGEVGPGAPFALLAGLACLGAVLTGWLLCMPAIEVVVELALLRMYRIRAHGPGAGRLPQSGPLLLVANHSSYADPLWLGKVVPRRLTPMMTSVFYDKPVLRWLMRRVVGAIRVQAGRFRREAPELQEAVTALRGGRCVLIFPEGILRRTEEKLLRPFGQGAWHILREVPEAPVVVCWIEGGWGSFASYRGGPPMKNKKLDRGLHIDIAFSEPRPLPAEVLADQRATRTYLMRACLDCRRHLGLEVPPLPGDAEAEEEP
jgi:1-acyl-sn-glycerol-3-phosphate acyltransferase